MISDLNATVKRKQVYERGENSRNVDTSTRRRRRYLLKFSTKIKKTVFLYFFSRNFLQISKSAPLTVIVFV